MMFQVFKSAVGHSIFGGSVIIHWQAQWIWTWKKLQCLTVKPFVSVFCCLCFLSIMNVESLEEGSHWLYIYLYISKMQIFAYINIDKHFGKSSHSRQHTTISVYEMISRLCILKKVNVMGWKVYHFIFVGKSILSFISTWLRFSYTCHKGCFPPHPIPWLA